MQPIYEIYYIFRSRPINRVWKRIIISNLRNGAAAVRSSQSGRGVTNIRRLLHYVCRVNDRREPHFLVYIFTHFFSPLQHVSIRLSLHRPAGRRSAAAGFAEPPAPRFFRVEKPTVRQIVPTYLKVLHVYDALLSLLLLERQLHMISYIPQPISVCNTCI